MSRLRSPHAEFLCLIAVLVLPAWTQDPAVPIALQVPLLANVLRFDRSMRERPGDELVVLVAYQSNYGPSRDFREELMEYVASHPTEMVHDKRLRWDYVEVSSAESIARECAQRGAAVLYLGPIRAVSPNDLSAAAASAGALTVSGVSDHVPQGAAVGFGLRGGRPRILVNLPSARAAGADFSSQLLQVVEFVAR